MRIIELTLQGAQGEQRFAFPAGLHILHEPDEKRRAHCLNGLITVLYGPPEELPRFSSPLEGESRSKRKKTVSRKNKSENNDTIERFEGTLLLALDDGRKFQLRRSIAETTSVFHVFDVQTGKDVTAEHQHGQGFAERQLSLSRAVFVAAACLQAGGFRLFAEAEEEALAVALSKVLDSASAKTSILTAIQRIDRKLAEIGTVYSYGSLLAGACARRDDLQQKRHAYVAAKRANSDDHAEADELHAEINIMQTRLSILEHEAIALELASARARLTRHDDCRKQIERIAAEQAALGGFKDFPVSMKENFFQMHHELIHLEKLQELLNGERNNLSLKLIALTERTNASGVDEDIWQFRSFEEFYASRTQWQATFEEILALETAKHEADAALDAAGLDAADRDALAALDLNRLEILKKREAAIKTQERDVERLRMAYDDFQRRTQSYRRAGALVALAVLAAITIGLFYLDGEISRARVWGGVLPLLLSIGGLLLFLFLNYRWLLKSRQLASDLLLSEKAYMENHEELREMLIGFKVQNLGELIRQRMLFMEIGSASQEHAKRAEELSRTERFLKLWMEPLGLDHIAMETLVSAEKRLRESYQLWQEQRNSRQQLERITEQLKEIEESHQPVSAEIEKALAAARISLPPGESSFQVYVQACQKREYLETLQSQARQIEELAKEILRGQTREQLVDEIDEMENSIRRFAEPRLAGEFAETLTPAHIRERIEKVEKELAEKRQVLAVNQERMRLRDQARISVAEIDEALAMTEDQIGGLHASQQALQLARNNLLTVKHHVHHDFARRATAVINRHIEFITNGHISSAKLDPADFSLQLTVKQDIAKRADANSINPASLRSIYLLLRLNMPALMAESRESIPLLIEASRRDDDFLQNAYINRVLESAGGEQQVLVFAEDKKVAGSVQEKTGMIRGRKVAEKI